MHVRQEAGLPVIAILETVQAARVIQVPSRTDAEAEVALFYVVGEAVFRPDPL